MLKSFTIALLLAITGDTVAQALDIPIPGAALGMLLLTAHFALRGGVGAQAARLFDLASPHFPLFFVPAATGIVAASDVMAVAWIHVVVAVVAGTAVTIVVTGLVCRHLLQHFTDKGSERCQP